MILAYSYLLRQNDKVILRLGAWMTNFRPLCCRENYPILFARSKRLSWKKYRSDNAPQWGQLFNHLKRMVGRLIDLNKQIKIGHMSYFEAYIVDMFFQDSFSKHMGTRGVQCLLRWKRANTRRRNIIPPPCRVADVSGTGFSFEFKIWSLLMTR